MIEKKTAQDQSEKYIRQERSVKKKGYRKREREQERL